jgi:hypothetical protein
LRKVAIAQNKPFRRLLLEKAAIRSRTATSDPNGPPEHMEFQLFIPFALLIAHDELKI